MRFLPSFHWQPSLYMYVYIYVYMYISRQTSTLQAWSASYERDERDRAQPVADPDRRASLCPEIQPRSILKLSVCLSVTLTAKPFTSW